MQLSPPLINPSDKLPTTLTRLAPFKQSNGCNAELASRMKLHTRVGGFAINKGRKQAGEFLPSVSVFGHHTRLWPTVEGHAHGGGQQ